MLSSPQRNVSCYMQLVRFVRSRPKFSPNASFSSIEEDVEDGLAGASVSSSNTRREDGEHGVAVNSFDVTELERDQNAKGPQLTNRILGKEVAHDVRIKRKRMVTRSRDTLKQPQLSKLKEVELSKLLRKHVIYADDSLAILNKPFGISANDGDKICSSLHSCLPILSKMIYGLNSSARLVLCNRLDKGTTGIIVFARNNDMARKVKELFRQQKVRRKYWAVTVGTPVSPQGILDIPLSLRHIQGDKRSRSHCRMVLAPQQKLDFQTGEMVDVRRRNAEVALTHYKTLDTHAGLSLIELQPFTSTRHQLRVHLSEGLSCCILGDHKYSQTEKLLPQRLPSSILSRFGLQPTGSRNMPMHLHLREVILPGILDGTKANLLVSAKLPEYFYKTTKLFRLKPGAETDFVYLSNRRREHDCRRNNPSMEELYVDPFESQESEVNEVQRDDCYAVYKPKIKAEFRFNVDQNTTMV